MKHRLQFFSETSKKGFTVKYTVILGMVFTVISSLLSSCATIPPNNQAEKLVPLKTITVLPVETVINDKVPIDKTKKMQLLEGKDVLNNLLAEYFTGHESVTFISEEQIGGMDIDFSLCPTYIDRSRAICLNIGSDAALVVRLHRYREREGTKYSVAAPASVFFEYKLIEVKTGNALCWGRFDETQKPLLDDMFSFIDKTKKRGVKWITVKELTKEGIEDKFNNCPYLKH